MTDVAGDDPEPMRRAAALIDLGRHEAALPFARRAAAADPTDAEALCLLARCHSALGEVDEAVAVAGRAAACAPEWGLPHYVASRTLVFADRPKEALPLARRAAELAPDSAMLLANLAVCLARTGKRRDAFATIERALGVGPDDAAVRIDASYIALMARRWSSAAEHARAALAIVPENATAMNNLAAAIQKQGRRGEALDLFVRSARSDPTGKGAANARRTAAAFAGMTAAGLAGIALLAVGRAAVRSLNPPAEQTAQGWTGNLLLVVVMLAFVVVVGVRVRAARRERSALSPTARRLVEQVEADNRRRIARLMIRAVGLLAILALIGVVLA